MTLYRVSILDHPRVDYLVSFCGNGAVWCLERIAIVQFFQRTQPELKNALINGRITGRGFYLPVIQASALGKRYQIPLMAFSAIWEVACNEGRGKAGTVTERAFEYSVNNRFFEPTFYRVIRKATLYEDTHLGVDFICKSDVSENSGVQVKWDSKAENSGNLWIQIETEPVTGAWTASPSQSGAGIRKPKKERPRRAGPTT